MRKDGGGVSDDYSSFLAGKLALQPPCGFEPGEVPDGLFSYQSDLTRWAIRRGRAAVFADTGLGKTRCLLAWAQQVAARTGRVLILTPLAVAQQTVAEGARISVDVKQCRDADDC